MPAAQPASTLSQPLELLFDSVSHGKVTITSVALAEITGAYLQKLAMLHEPDPNRLAAYAELGAKLVHLKSQALLPSESADEPSGLTELNLQLKQYLDVKARAESLRQRLSQSSYTRPQPRRRTTRPAPGLITPISLNQLEDAWRSVQNRQPHQWHAAPATPRLSHHEAKTIVQAALDATPVPLRQLFTSHPRPEEIIAIFLAVLELVKAGKLQVVAGRASWELARV